MLDGDERIQMAEMLAWSQDRSTGHAMRFLRTELGLDRPELACRLGISPQEVFAYEDALKQVIPIDIDRKLRDLWTNPRR